MTDPNRESDRKHDGGDAAPRPLRLALAIVLWIFGVALPATALIVELTTRMCAEELFDPLPTPLHVLLVAA
ncbi:MAG TPA: hypothetical protein VN923_10275, partial [Thermoanaerobaculia bacterium]|nr:hypothetical protein [Thermoanaerobaculia bacterium]